MRLETSEKVIRNTIWNSGGYLWGLLVSLLLTPYILSKIGIEQFGIWVLMAVVVNYFSLLDFPGIGGAFVKYIAEYHTRRDYKKVNRIVNLGFSYYLTFWVTVSLGVLILKKPLLGLFNFSAELYDEALFVLIGILFISVLRGTLSVFRSLLLGLQRMDITNLIAAIISIPNIIGTVLFLSLGFGLKGLVVNGIIVALLTVTAQVIWVYRLSPWIKFRLFSWDREMFRRTFAYGLKIQVARFSELINTHIDKILLGHFLNMSMVGFYELGAKIANITRSFPAQLLPAIVPAASQLDTLEDKESLNKLYYRGSKYLALIALPLTFFVIMNAAWIIQLWLGRPGYSYAYAVLALQVLSLGYAVSLLVSMARLIARGMGIPQYEMRSSLLIAGLNILLSTILIIKIGFVGALLGTVLSAIIGSLYFILIFHRHLRQSFLRLIAVKIYPLPLFACVLGALGSWAVTYWVPLFDISSPGRLATFRTLTIRGITFIGIYGLILLKTSYLDAYDREIFTKGRRVIRSAFRPEHK